MTLEKKLLSYKDYLVSWIQEEVKKANMKGVIIGISGGVDSAVVAALAKAAFPKTSLGLIMPTKKIDHHYKDAKNVAKNLKIKTQIINLSKAFETIKETTKLKNNLAIANIQPRLRMTTLYAFAQEHRLLVLGTDNAAEWLLGYFTKYGDGGVDLLPLIHLKKHEVKKMAELLNLPTNIYQKAPTADLWENQTDEKELGFTYDYVDQYLANKDIPEDIKTKIEHQNKITAHKRQSLPRPKTLEAFNKKN